MAEKKSFQEQNPNPNDYSKIKKGAKLVQYGGTVLAAIAAAVISRDKLKAYGKAAFDFIVKK